MYTNENCPSCDCIITELTNENYFFRRYNIAENAVKVQLEKILATDNDKLINELLSL